MRWPRRRRREEPVFLGRRDGERTSSGETGAAVAEIVRFLGLAALLILGTGLLLVLTGHGQRIDDLMEFVRQFDEILLAIFGGGGALAAARAMRDKPVNANAEVASVATERKVDDLGDAVAAVAADNARLLQVLEAALSELGHRAPAQTRGARRADTGTLPAVPPQEQLPVYPTVVPPDPDAEPLSPAATAAAWATWEDLQRDYDKRAHHDPADPQEPPWSP